METTSDLEVAMPAMFTVLPKDTGVRGTPILGFDFAAGVWTDGPYLFRGVPEIPPGTRFIAVTPQVQYGFRRSVGKYVVATTRDYAEASPLYRNSAWWRTMFCHCADLATGAVAFTFLAFAPERMVVINQLIAATHQRAALGVYALPIVELARETYRFSDTRHLITNEIARGGGSPCAPQYAPSPGLGDDMDFVLIRRYRSSTGLT